MDEEKFWQGLFYVSWATVVIWAILKSVGIIQTPIWLELGLPTVAAMGTILAVLHILQSPALKAKRKFDKLAKEPLQQTVSGGWIAMLQHHFMAAWIPDAGDSNTFATAIIANGTPRYVIREVGPSLSAQPGASASSEARLWIGPKLQSELPHVAPGLERTIDYGIFTLISDPLFAVLSFLHSLFGNWGWAIIGLVVLIKGVFFKLSEKQYLSMAKMRKLQPRIEALKERYGEDKQKFQQAMLELYKKEKANPASGCLPILIQIPVFIALYWVLLESVELRHAPWIGWIQSLTDRDPYFVLPVLNMLSMYFTQKLSPAPGMDPIQKKFMLKIGRASCRERV